jgi:hypothetical protein
MLQVDLPLEQAQSLFGAGFYNLIKKKIQDKITVPVL